MALMAPTPGSFMLDEPKMMLKIINKQKSDNVESTKKRTKAFSVTPPRTQAGLATPLVAAADFCCVPSRARKRKCVQ